jgi:hypothetical protein
LPAQAPIKVLPLDEPLMGEGFVLPAPPIPPTASDDEKSHAN